MNEYKSHPSISTNEYRAVGRNLDLVIDDIKIANATCDCMTTTHLPSAKEYSEATEKLAFQFIAQWSEPKYQCPECGGGMRRNEMVVLTSYPAQYEYQCDKCGHIDYQYM